MSSSIESRRPSKVSIVGAGSVGSSMAYACLIRGSADVVALYDIAKERVDAEVADLAHGSEFVPSRVMGGGDVNETANSDVVIITAGARQKPGQSRLDLVGVNAGIVSSLMSQLVPQSPNAIFVIVTNPCDVLAVVAQQVSGLPENRVFSSGTLLDSSRLRFLVSQWADVTTPNVHAVIAGEHGDSEFPVWSTANISGVPIRDWTVDGEQTFTQEVLDDLGQEAALAAYKIIEGKGATNYGIGLTGARLTEALLGAGRCVLPVSAIVHDLYGIDGVALSLPRLVSRDGIGDTVPIPLIDSEVTELKASAERLHETLLAIKS
ncbi:L-lactate dehydrogenase [Acidipropionibacterium jensenii]|uniref:L-lactate dehydrogenase n=1 Tax=Acidipropionibacterium jensenii TaxID=1749 RepID=A0A3Q9UIK8_9ACTN|nr:L-lactate dehydrogenase [Acidipropionibacterium jensenii]AZZ38432.1 L-lactate dehydrogenase [Acidipropionibacterium jensenii]